MHHLFTSEVHLERVRVMRRYSYTLYSIDACGSLNPYSTLQKSIRCYRDDLIHDDLSYENRMCTESRFVKNTVSRRFVFRCALRRNYSTKHSPRSRFTVKDGFRSFRRIRMGTSMNKQPTIHLRVPEYSDNAPCKWEVHTGLLYMYPPPFAVRWLK